MKTQLLAELKTARAIGSTGAYRDGAAVITARDAPQQLKLVPVATGKRPARRERELFGHEFKREA